MREDIERDMRLMGCTSIDQLNRENILAAHTGPLRDANMPV